MKAAIDDTDTAECPVSLITSGSLLALELVNRNRHVHAATGGCLFGADASRWPARLVDAIELIEIEKIRVENKRAEVEDEDLRRRQE